MEASRDIARLIEIMAALRDPETGCPWDVRQSFASIAPYTIEEAYEVADAVARADMRDLVDELGDLLLQVVFHARMAEEDGAFDFGDVVQAITTKMIRRHPHVFVDPGLRSSDAAKASWDAVKALEKAERARERAADTDNSPGEAATGGLLDGVPTALPAMTRALKLQERAATVGFDWPEAEHVIGKVEEEVSELRAALRQDDEARADRVRDEIGDLFFVLVNLARHLGVDPERALRETNEKVRRRFRHLETALEGSGRRLEDASLDEMEALWVEAKRKEAR